MLRKLIPAVWPQVICKTSDASASRGELDHPLPTLKESEGLNSSERYVPGRSAFGSSGRGRALAFFSSPPQALSAKTTSTTRSPRLRTRPTTNRRFIYHSYCATHPTSRKVNSPKFTPCRQTRRVIPMTDAPSDLNDPCSRNHSCTPHERPGP